MKPTLSKSLRALLAGTFVVSSSAMADYNGGRITNQDNTYTGNINISYIIDDAERHGGVEITGEEAQGTTTTLEGNIHIEAGRGLENSDDERKNYGILIARDPNDTDYPNPDPGYNATVILKTAGADDQIRIDTYGLKSAGVWNLKQDTKVVLDSSSSGKDIEINLHHAGDTADHGRALATDLGNIEVIGNLKLTTAGANAAGIYNYMGNISVTGNTTYTGTGNSSIGIRTNGGSIIQDGNVNITTTAHGIMSSAAAIDETTRQGGSIVIKGDATVSVNNTLGGDYYYHGLYAAGESTSIEVQGKSDITVGANSAGIRAKEGAFIKLNDATVNAVQTAVSLSTGGYAHIQGNLDVTMQNGSQTDHAIGISASELRVSGKANIQSDTATNLYHAVMSNNGSAITFENDVTATAGGIGLRALGTSTITVLGSVDVVSTSNSAVASGAGSKITLNGAIRISGLTSLWSGDGGVIEARSAYYNIEGAVRTARTGSSITLHMAQGSYLNGAVEFSGVDIDTQSITLSLAGQSQWVVAGNSTLTDLTVDGTSWLSFNLLDSGTMTFAGINASSIALADGAVLQLLGVSSTDFDVMGRALTTFTASLLNADSLTANGVKLVTADNYELTYTNNGDGSFSVTGVTGGQLFIPEPASATLGLLGLSLLMLRRRRA